MAFAQFTRTIYDILVSYINWCLLFTAIAHSVQGMRHFITSTAGYLVKVIPSESMVSLFSPFLFLVKNTKWLWNVIWCHGYARMQMNDGMHRDYKPLAFLFRLTWTWTWTSIKSENTFLGAPKHLLNWLCPLVCLSVCRYVGNAFVRWSIRRTLLTY